jgi:hypothetical protein
MIATVDYFNIKRQQAKANVNLKPSTPIQNFERTSIVWSDILKIFIELNEAKRESAFHRFDKKNFDDDGNLYGGMDDDTSTCRASDDGSVYSYSLHSRTSTVLSPPSIPRSSFGGSTSKSVPSSASASTLSMLKHSSSSTSGNHSPTHLSNTLRNSVLSVSNMHNSAIKMFGTIGNSVNDAIGSTSNGQIGSTSKTYQHSSDDYDSKVRYDIILFLFLLTNFNFFKGIW